MTEDRGLLCRIGPDGRVVGVHRAVLSDEEIDAGGWQPMSPQMEGVDSLLACLDVQAATEASSCDISELTHHLISVLVRRDVIRITDLPHGVQVRVLQRDERTVVARFPLLREDDEPLI